MNAARTDAQPHATPVPLRHGLTAVYVTRGPRPRIPRQRHGWAPSRAHVTLASVAAARAHLRDVGLASELTERHLDWLAEAAIS